MKLHIKALRLFLPVAMEGRLMLDCAIVAQGHTKNSPPPRGSHWVNYCRLTLSRDSQAYARIMFARNLFNN